MRLWPGNWSGRGRIPNGSFPDGLRTMLPQDGWLYLFVWCTACYHQAPADLQAIIDAGQAISP
jgi:hypothetical protein